VGWFDKLKAGLGKTAGKVAVALGFKALDAAARESLEEALLSADVGPKAAAELVAEVAKGGERPPREMLAAAIEKRLKSLEPGPGSGMGSPAAETAADPSAARVPVIILLVGVNGSGKTTTLGKLAHIWVAAKKKVIVGAADTFRAGAVDQLAVWCARAKVPLVRAEADRADPAGVAYRAVERAVAEKADIVAIDTAGRLPNRADLMAELGKITRAVGKVLPGAPQAVWLVLDATLGQATLQHVKLFKEVAGVTGLVVTKLDSSAKGGFLLPLAAEGLPVVAVGVGESIEDLGEFEAGAVASGMVGGG
jgi:fused signal recognition particle receptor